jgi:hypothetical protein
MNATSNFKFKMPRTGGDLIMDTYLVVKLPTIWSPIIPPDKENPNDNTVNKWRPYEFKWIKHLGSQMIERVRFTIGGQVIQEFTGQYLHNMIERDYDANKKELYYKMIGHVPELNDPANAHDRVNVYPNAYKMMDDSSGGPEPSIRSRSLYIPLNIWFTLASKMAFPIAALQYNEFHIEVDLRPINELYVIRHIPDTEDPGSYYHQSNLNEAKEQFHRFLHPPPTAGLLDEDFTDTRTNWDTDIHLISTYAFLSEDEQRVFQLNEQNYLIKQVYTHTYKNVNGSNIIDIETRGMVSSWMWFLQRSDIAHRNQWSNYTNWPYDFLPYNVDTANSSYVKNLDYDDSGWETVTQYLTPEYDFDYDSFNNIIQQYPSSIMISGKYYPENQKDIMETWGLLLDGKYRENTMDAGIFNYVEKYTRTAGNGPDGLYCYNFCLNNNVTDFQPSGAINMSKFNKIQFEMGIITPPLDPSSQVDIVCNADGNMIGIDKTRDSIFDYTYDLTVMEERYNVLTFSSGNAALSYAR